MADYSDFSVERFVMDEGFQSHVKHPTVESTLFWEQWLESHSHKADEIRQARLIILSMAFQGTPEEQIPREKLLQRIQASIHAGDESVVPLKHSFFQHYRRIAAVFIGLVIAAASLYLLTSETHQTYATAYGEIKHFILPDGSRMTLNANSSVQFEKTWDEGDTREVVLVGEAFFDIVHTKNHERFLVRTKRLDVEVLGTEFNVQTRRMRTRVVLNSGKVRINMKGPGDSVLYLEPGELVEINSNVDAISKRVVDPEDFSSWREGRLIFKATPLSEVAHALEDYYGWKATFEDAAMREYKFTGAVSTESMDDISLLLYTISESFDIHVQQDGDQLIFRKHK